MRGRTTSTSTALWFKSYPVGRVHLVLAIWLLLVVTTVEHLEAARAAKVKRKDHVQDAQKELELRRSTAKYQQYMLQNDGFTESDLEQLLRDDDDEKGMRIEQIMGDDDEKGVRIGQIEQIMDDDDEKGVRIEQIEQIMDDETQAKSYDDWESRIFTKPYHLGTGAAISDWEDQRTVWLYRHSHVATVVHSAKARVLLITGSQPTPCPNPGGDHFHLKAIKNKIDYARIHDFEILYNLSFLDSSFDGVWTKLPIIRTVMLTHPEIEWFMWMDADAIFTDMLFEIPFHEYEDYNLVIWAWKEGFQNKDWVSVNDGVFLLRNCQWSLDLFDKWSPMGPRGEIRDTAGKYLSSFLANRRGNYPADDQSALLYVMLKHPEIMEKVKLVEKEYRLHGYWVDIVQHFEEFMEKYHPGLGDCRWPFTTHFTGCSPCTGQNNPQFPLRMCMNNFNRAYNFADNQILAYMGYKHETLDSPHLIRIRNDTTEPLRLLGVNPWKERVEQVAAAGMPPFSC